MGGTGARAAIPVTSAFAAATAVTPTGPSSYSVTIDPAWSIGGVPNGGYSLALATRAALAAVEHPDPLAVSGHFTRPPVFGPAEVSVDVLRTGRRTATVRASLRQNDALCLEALISAGSLPDPTEPDTVEWSARPAPDLPAPDHCVVNRRAAFDVALLDVVEERIDPATLPFDVGEGGKVSLEPKGSPLLRGWLRLADGAEPDPLALILMVDAMPPTVFNIGKFGWAPTVELTVVLRGRPATGWLRAEATTQLVSGGWFDEEAAVWDSAGNFVVQSRQLALVGRR